MGNLEIIQNRFRAEVIDRIDKSMVDIALGIKEDVSIKHDNRKWAIVQTKGNDHKLAWADNITGEIFENDDYSPGKSIKAKFIRWGTGFDV